MLQRVMIALCLLSSPCGAVDVAADPPDAPETPALLASAGLLTDVDLLQRAYEQLHPGLLRYNTPAQIDAGFDALRAEFARDRSLEDVYLALSRFAATIRCGHTYANFFNQSRAVQQRLFERADRVPFHFRWLDGRMIVSENHSRDQTLVPGTEVLAIDGIPVATLLSQLRTIARADGGNDAKRIAWLEVQGYDDYEAFDIFLPLLFPDIDTGRLRVRRPGDDAPQTLVVAPLTYTERLRSSRSEPGNAADAPAWTLDLSRADFAMLRMPTWALYDSTWDWRGFLRTSFDTLAERGTPALVIDLRGNEGGLNVGYELLARLIEHDLVVPTPQQLVRYRRVPGDLLPFLDTWDRSFRDWGDQAKPFDARFLRLTRYDDTPDDGADGDVIRAVAPRYAGRVFVLVGAENSSATFEFARDLQRSGRGTLVGQTTGGNRRGINGGAFFFLRLPASGIELDLPLIGQFPSEPQPDAGIEPDIAVVVTADDIAQRRDVELAAVLASLRETQPKAAPVAAPAAEPEAD